MLKQVHKDKWKLGKQGAVGSGMSGESVTGRGRPSKKARDGGNTREEGVCV